MFDESVFLPAEEGRPATSSDFCLNEGKSLEKKKPCRVAIDLTSTLATVLQVTELTEESR